MIDQEQLISVVREQRLLWDKRHKNYRNRLLTKKAWKNVAETLGCSNDEAQGKWKNLRDSFSRELKKIPKKQSGANVEVAEYTGDWLYFEALKFLKGVIRTRKNKPNVRNTLVEETDTVDDESIISVLSNSTEISSNTDNQTLTQTEFESCPPQLITEIEYETKQSTSAFADGHLLSSDITQNEYLTYESPRIIGTKNIKQNNVEEMFADLERQKIELLKKDIEFQEDEDMNWFKSILPHLKTLPPLNKFMFRTKVQEMLLNELTKFNSSQPGPSSVPNSSKYDSL